MVFIPSCPLSPTGRPLLTLSPCLACFLACLVSRFTGRYRLPSDQPSVYGRRRCCVALFAPLLAQGQHSIVRIDFNDNHRVDVVRDAFVMHYHLAKRRAPTYPLASAVPRDVEIMLASSVMRLVPVLYVADACNRRAHRSPLNVAPMSSTKRRASHRRQRSIRRFISRVYC